MHGRIGRVNFDQGLVLIHCSHGWISEYSLTCQQMNLVYCCLSLSLREEGNMQKKWGLSSWNRSALTVVVVVCSPTTELLEPVDCLLRDSQRYFSNSNRNLRKHLIVRLQVATDPLCVLLDSLHYFRRISCLTSIQGIEQSTNWIDRNLESYN